MNFTENESFSNYEHLCSQTEKMSDHSQYSDDLTGELCKTTGLEKRGDFIEDNIGDIDTQGSARKNTRENDVDDVMEMSESNVKKSQHNKQFKNDNCSAKDNSKDEKTEISCICEVADDKGVNESSRLECKTLDREEDINPDSYTIKSNTGSVELDKSVPNKDEDNFATSRKYMNKGKNVFSTSRINLHPTNIIRNNVTNLPFSLLYVLKYSKDKPENNGDKISSSKRPFGEYKNFLTQEQPRFTVPKLYPPCTPSRRRKTWSEGRIYNSSERKAIYIPRRISESKVSVPLKCRTSSYPQSTNNSTELNSLLPPYQSSPLRFNRLRDSLELARLRWAQKPSFPLRSLSSSGRDTTSRYRSPSPGSSCSLPLETSIRLHRISSTGPDTIVDPRKFQHQVCPFVTSDPDTSRRSRDFHDSFSVFCGGAHSPKPTSDSGESCFSDFVAGRDSMPADKINSHVINRKWNKICYGRYNLKLRESRVKYRMPDIERRLF